MTPDQRPAIATLDIRTPLRASRVGLLLGSLYLLSCLAVRTVASTPRWDTSAALLLLLAVGLFAIAGACVLAVYEWTRVRTGVPEAIARRPPGVYTLRRAGDPVRALSWRALPAGTPIEPVYEEVPIGNDSTDASFQSVLIAAPLYASLVVLLAPDLRTGAAVFGVTCAIVLALAGLAWVGRVLQRLRVAPVFTHADPTLVSHKDKLAALRRTFRWEKSSLVIVGVSRSAARCVYFDHETHRWRTHTVTRDALDDLLGVAHAARLERERCGT